MTLNWCLLLPGAISVFLGSKNKPHTLKKNTQLDNSRFVLSPLLGKEACHGTRVDWLKACYTAWPFGEMNDTFSSICAVYQLRVLPLPRDTSANKHATRTSCERLPSAPDRLLRPCFVAQLGLEGLAVAGSHESVAKKGPQMV